MVLAVVVIVVVATLAAMGFFVSSDGNIEQSGLAQIHSIPTGASVTIDGETLFARTNLSRTIPEGTHQIKIARDKYDSWENNVEMQAGILLRLYYPRLFLLNRKQKDVLIFENDLALYEPSLDRTSILYAEKKSPYWQLLDIRGDEPKTTTLDMSEVLPDVKEGEFLGRVEKVQWSRNADHVLVKVWGETEAEWISVNLKDVKNSLNLTRTFGMNFEQVEMADGSAGKLFVLENQHLRRINTNDQEISRVLLDNVASFANSDGNIIYVSTFKDAEADKTIHKVGVYRDGEKGGTTVATLLDDAKVKTAIALYYGDYYLAYTSDNKMTVLYGSLPTYSDEGADLEGLETLLEAEELRFVPENLSVGLSDGYILAQSGKQLAIVGLEMQKLYQYEAETATVRWLDEDMFYATEAGELEVWDFDNTNKRKLVAYHAKATLDTEAAGAPLEADKTGFTAATTLSWRKLTENKVVITDNNKWLYYIVSDGQTGKKTLVRETIRE